MKKIISVLLSFCAILSCFLMPVSAATCPHYYFTYLSIKCYSTDSLSYHEEVQNRKCDSCGRTYVKVFINNHEDRNGDKKCDLCGKYGIVCDHSYSYSSSSTEYKYYDLSFHKKITVEKCKYCTDIKKSPEIITPHIDADDDKICDQCGYKDIIEVDNDAVPSCSHSGDTLAYNSYEEGADADHHHVIVNSNCDECAQIYVSKEYDEYHNDSSKDGICDICNIKVEHKNHIDNNDDDDCDLCGYIITQRAISNTYSVKSGEKIHFKIVCDNLPEGAYLALYDSIMGPYCYSWGLLTTSYDGCIEWTSDDFYKEDTYFTYKILDKDGNTIRTTSKNSYGYIKVEVEYSFFIRIISFFKRLFVLDYLI